MTTVNPDPHPTLISIDRKIDLLIFEVKALQSCSSDHEKRMRELETKVITLGVIFSITSLAGIIAFIKALFGL